METSRLRTSIVTVQSVESSIGTRHVEMEKMEIRPIWIHAQSNSVYGIKNETVKTQRGVNKCKIFTTLRNCILQHARRGFSRGSQEANWEDRGWE